MERLLANINHSNIVDEIVTSDIIQNRITYGKLTSISYIKQIIKIASVVVERGEKGD
jgi:hypothetical protein